MSQDLKVIRLRHIGIVVSDIDKTISILNNLFNLKLILKTKITKNKYINFLLGLNNVKIKSNILKLNDNSRVELLQFVNPKPKITKIKTYSIGITHFSITINSMSLFIKKIKNYNCKIVGKPMITPDKSAKVAYVNILNEFFIEVVEVLKTKAEFSGGK